MLTYPILTGTASDPSRAGEGAVEGARAQSRAAAVRQVLDVTPADINGPDIVDLDEPTFIRNRRVVGESSGALYRGGRMAGHRRHRPGRTNSAKAQG